MTYTARAALSKAAKTKTTAGICIVGTISLAGLVLGIINIFQKNALFSVIYLLACVIGLAFVVIKINTVVPTFVATSKHTLWMQNWKNGVFSFNVRFKPAFLCDFIPDKTKVDKVDFSKITKVMLGTKNFLTRNLQNERFSREMQALAACNPRCGRLLKRLDLLYIETIDGACYYMSVTDFDPAELVQVLAAIEAGCPNVQIKCNSREIRKRMTQSQ